MSDFRLVLRAQALNGETPVWCAARRRLFWIDLREPSLHEFDPATGADESWHMPAWIGCYGLTASGAVVALRTGLFSFDFDTTALTALAPAPFDARRFLFNDGRADPRGRFLVGTMYQPLPPGDRHSDAPKGTPLWRLEAGARWQPVTPDVQTSNGLAWSPDGRTMYHSDTDARTIWRWEYDPDSGAVANRCVFAQLTGLPDKAGPDGAAVDRDGFYWCAVYGAGVLHRYDPDGRLERTVAFPVRHPTMPAFGGAGLETIYVTSANWSLTPEQRRAEPDAGGLFAMPAPVPGLPEPYAALAVGG
ncbi:MAG: SMP-30/gluconolactonase/LRE family protein [Acidisphaera sp.]|nr:SMP-30/gluconolactonase/LRE family protein [Acidisphaera sp.]